MFVGLAHAYAFIFFIITFSTNFHLLCFYLSLCFSHVVNCICILFQEYILYEIFMLNKNAKHTSKQGTHEDSQCEVLGMQLQGGVTKQA
jgi:hypothetical protein